MSIALGIRCWKDRLALVALDGDGMSRPGVVLQRRVRLPDAASDGERVEWVHKTVIEAIQESGADAVAIRVSDGEPDQHRAEHEGVALLAATSRVQQAVTLRRQSMLKPLGVPKEAGVWADFPRTDPFISSFVGEERDAAMAAKAVLNRGRTP